MAQNESAHQSNQAPVRKSPLFFREENAGFIARGNFMTLALKPQLVEEGEWLAHQGR
jgi:MOB kinase activator 1